MLGKFDLGMGSNINGDASYPHGAVTATTLLGRPVNGHPNGIAPGADFYVVNRTEPATLALLKDSGIRILNFSVGSSGEADKLTDLESFRSYFSKSGRTKAYMDLQDWNILVVWATGNSGNASPGAQDTAPYIVPELKNWIMVTGLNLDGKTHDGTNRCGQRAMLYCMAAPGMVKITDPLNPSTVTWASGTSFAAPQVSGAAALVLEKYPWLTAPQLAETLLTTTNDLGEPGPDPVFGMGGLNIAKAINGPAALRMAWNATIPDGTTATFNNDLNGDGSLTKSGGGSLILNGRSQWTGDTTLNSGTLALHGSLGGNLTQTGGKLALDPTQGLAIKGEATLTQVGLHSNSWIGPSWNGTLLEAGQLNATGPGSMNGHTANSLFFSQTLSTDGNRINASLQRRQAGKETGDQSTWQAVRGLNAAFEQADRNGVAQSRERLAGMQFMDPGNDTNITLDSLSGQAHATARGMAIEAADIQQRWSLQRAREAARDTDRDGSGGTWAMAGTFGSEIRPGNAFSADVRSTLAAAGADRALNAHTLIGASVNTGQIQSDFNRNGGEVTTRSAGAGAYAAYRHGATTLSGFMGQQLLRNEIQRRVLTGNGSDWLTSRTRGTLTQAGLDLQYQVNPGTAFGLTAQRDWLRSQPFEEAGNSGFELIAGRSHSDRTSLGAYAQFFGGAPQGTDGWRFDGGLGVNARLGSVDTGLTAAYRITPDGTFRIDGMELPRTSLWGNAGILRKKGRNTLFLRTDIRHDRNGTAPALSAGWRRGL